MPSFLSRIIRNSLKGRTEERGVAIKGGRSWPTALPIGLATPEVGHLVVCEDTVGQYTPTAMAIVAVVLDLRSNQVSENFGPSTWNTGWAMPAHICGAKGDRRQ